MPVRPGRRDAPADLDWQAFSVQPGARSGGLLTGIIEMDNATINIPIITRLLIACINGLQGN